MSIIVVADPIAVAADTTRACFIRRTYTHVSGTVLVFAVLEALLLRWPGAPALAALMTRGYAWLVVLAAFVGLAHLAERWARSDASRPLQYAGLGLYVVAEAVLFLPLLWVATVAGGRAVIPAAALLTGAVFVGLTTAVLVSGADFTVLRGALAIGGGLAFGLIVASVLFGVTLGLVFSAAMIVYAAGAILYQTSGTLRDYRADQHVAAALGLFAGAMLLLWYAVRLLLELLPDD